MRYLIDPEFRVTIRQKPSPPRFPFASVLRRELGQRNTRWALDNGYAHEVSLGAVPAVLYREDELGRHGNFLDDTYRRIQETPIWASRLRKVHTSAKRALLSRDPGHRELDSSNSSDALLMNIFCHHEVTGALGLDHKIASLLGVTDAKLPRFGVRPGVPLKNAHLDRTEIDMHIGDLFVEAKLTESGFQQAKLNTLERYLDLDSVFDVSRLPSYGCRQRLPAHPQRSRCALFRVLLLRHGGFEKD